MDGFPSSPPMLSRDATEPPSSSSPPVFSSDGPMEDADAENYAQRRSKRKYKGPWYEKSAFDNGEGSSQPAAKKSKFTRNFDSGVFMPSDEDLPSTQETNHDLVPSKIKTVPTYEERIVQHKLSWFPKHNPDESFTEATVKELVRNNECNFRLDFLKPAQEDLQCLTELNKIIKLPLDPGIRAPGEYYYRSMAPQLFLDLSNNDLKRMPPSVFDIEYLTDLIFRNNGLEVLPDRIVNLEHLRTLDLSNNNLSYLPYELLGPMMDGFKPRLAGNPLMQCEGIVSDEVRTKCKGPSALVYYDEAGRPLNWTSKSECHEHSKAPSLFALSLAKSMNTYSIEDIRDELDDEMPPEVSTALDTAERNVEEYGSPLRICFECGREFVMVKAEWTQWYPIGGGTPLPFKQQLCSLGCVPSRVTEQHQAS
ncbi:hypothetical protein BDV96DRAFT_580585 [Lophiotrema nucula]|uniref:Uncharacterized protein n=1 Tax=Lophiotrema nucula TaxID=690887 RepID=A0A6A5YZX6_9PLEO|nr:hypothetical protein BDV96DRAFT_580585 [Lophiotrema nucula]